MRNTILSAVAAFFIGVVVTLFTMYQMAPGMMIIETKSSINNFDSAVAKFEESVKTHGWKLPKVHDLQATMNKFGHDVKAVKVFELCHPDHAAKILKLDAERVVSSMMPCRVAIYEKSDGNVYVSRMNSSLMAGMMDGIIPEVMEVAYNENEQILEAILN